MPHLPALVVGHRLADLRGRIHHERSVSDDGLVDRLAARSRTRDAGARPLRAARSWAGIPSDRHSRRGGRASGPSPDSSRRRASARGSRHPPSGGPRCAGCSGASSAACRRASMPSRPSLSVPPRTTAWHSRYRRTMERGRTRFRPVISGRRLLRALATRGLCPRPAARWRARGHRRGPLRSRAGGRGSPHRRAPCTPVRG